MTSRWGVLTAVVPDALEDEIAAVLGGGSLGVEVASSGPGRSRVSVYFAPDDDVSAWRERARLVLSAHGLGDADASVAVDAVEDGRWVERWQETLAPIPLGTRFVVMPRMDFDARGGRDPIRLIPGMAFGTGEHQTTRLCAAALEREVRPGSRWIDVGTGTGLLAIVAARLGASRVLAVDDDREAVRVAVAVVAANQASDCVEVRAGSLEGRGQETFDGVVANIQSSFFLARAADLAATLTDRGVLLASGLLVADLPEVGRALEAAGLTLTEPISDGPWALVRASRRRV